MTVEKMKNFCAKSLCGISGICQLLLSDDRLALEETSQKQSCRRRTRATRFPQKSVRDY